MCSLTKPAINIHYKLNYSKLCMIQREKNKYSPFCIDKEIFKYRRRRIWIVILVNIEI